MQLARSTAPIFVPFALSLLLGQAHPAAAVDGVIEINQAGALAGNITPGDAPGFPVEISTAGSYRLTGDLAVPADATAGIAITADGTRLDLNGFTIAGLGAGQGIGIDASGASAVSVRNGRVRGFGVYGLFLFNSCRAEDLTVEANTTGGIVVDEGCTVVGNTVRGNGRGIEVGATGRVTSNVVDGNTGTGISATTGALVERNVVTRNGGVGIIVTDDSHVNDNTVSSNAKTGIAAGSFSQIARNTVNANAGCGISLRGQHAWATRNMVGNNGRYGLQNDFAAFQTIGGNNFQFNRGATPEGLGNQLSWKASPAFPSPMIVEGEPSTCNNTNFCAAFNGDVACP